MNIRVHSQQKTPQPSTAAPVTNPFQSRPFAVQAQAEQSSPQQQEISEQEQQQKVKRCGYNFANVSVSDRSKAVPETPIIQQQFVRNEQTIVDTSQQKHPLVQRLQAKSMQHQLALEVGKVSPLGSYVRQNFHVQPKLAIGQPGDKYEQEADKVAEQVISMPEIAAGRTPVQRQGKEEESLQKKSLVDSITPLVQRQEEEDIHEVQANQSLENRLAAQKGGGSPLSNEVRSFMEPRFGTDFSQVRVHTNSEAVQMNRELHAQAFTHGRDLYFGTGKYNPSSIDGKRLLAHELTHVVQQTGGVQAFFQDQAHIALARNIAHLNDSNVDRQPTTVNLGTTNGMIQRFESNEHKAMGDKGSADNKGKATLIKLSKDLTVTFGEITAMAGDFFGSVEEIQKLAQVSGNNGQGKDSDKGNYVPSDDEIKYVLQEVLHVKVRREKDKEKDEPIKFSDNVKNAVWKRYDTLASGNKTHFTNPKKEDEGRTFEQKSKDRNSKGETVNNEGSYRQNHIRAIEEAVKAGKIGGPKDTAMLYEAFASHFLTDAYSAGHMRTARAAISEYWNKKVPMFWTNLKWWMAEQIAQHINDNTMLSGCSLKAQFLWEESRKTLNKILKTKDFPDLNFGDVISGAVHDYDNQKGIQADVGGKLVKLVGDGEVLEQKDRLLAAGVDTMTKAVAGVKASLKDIENAYAKGRAGETNVEKVIASLQLKDNLFRAEQLWPKALPDSDTRQTNKSLNWEVATVEDLFKDPSMQEALANFAKEKANILEEKFSFAEQYQSDALKQGVLAKLKANKEQVIKTFREIVYYTPGSGSVAQLGGVGGHDSDDNAVDYYNEAINKRALNTLTFKQKDKLIRDVLDGVTMGDEEPMIVNLLGAKLSDAPALIKQFGWNRMWRKLDGKDCRNFVQKFGPSYWKQQSFEMKRAEVKFLADGRTNDLAQETIITILRTCTSAEIRKIDDEVGGWTGLTFDLDGKWNTEFKKMKAK